LPRSELAVRASDGWRVWWRSSLAPGNWGAGDAFLARSARWTRVRQGVEYTEIELSGGGEAWRTLLVVARIDPRVLRLSLDTAFADARAVWSTKRLKNDQVFAVNAGQFAYALPWGLVILNGKQFLPPGSGPLASAFVVDSSGAVHWLHGSVARAASGAAWAFQSY